MKFPGNDINAEENAYKAFFHQYNAQVFSYIERKIKKKEDIMDTLQEVFIHLWEYRRNLYSENAENIIFNTCNQKISKFYKTAKKQPFYENKEVDCPDTSVEELQSENKKEYHLTELEKSVELLIPPLRRKIFKMNKLDGITQKQIAILLNISIRTVENHISEAMLFLKNHHKNS